MNLFSGDKIFTEVGPDLLNSILAEASPVNLSLEYLLLFTLFIVLLFLITLNVFSLDN